MLFSNGEESLLGKRQKSAALRKMESRVQEKVVSGTGIFAVAFLA